jgi:hypothetical protein
LLLLDLDLLFLPSFLVRKADSARTADVEDCDGGNSDFWAAGFRT